ncbi:MAG: V/A-type H+/Na+-transporting ATPase subunit [Thermoanaerobacteraceae bacterium]|uniref:ATP synthase F(0) sector subunit c n=1 Tax=Biomaibacter acetigenes TaxID=2316383 RepID=A0A3G2R8C4_9FIRM|nr:ATP synthase subunit C [Biomaibacter acetigenes]AYO31686.1 ATPase [Biomaibacter acetigenes]MDK2879215.1 V/A-type H+/Na+-transporting ATPase subunit [Thermoanaerobacteraceae bacterium]MDN5312584.1 V/A-type H+/Na+-transporting ATPase subunit [Thermoanaerobacteraceae bacterium]RKL62619.1 ATPase [Thermoanaerobacteraceae bacterium SP2]
MYAVLFIAMAISGLTVAAGLYIYLMKDEAKARKVKKLVRFSVISYAVLVAAFLFFLVPGIASAASSANPASGMGFIAAALATGLATIGAGYAVGAVGSSALGAVSEDPNILGKTLIFVGLAEGIAIYGLIVSIMILGRL